ncbi:substrate-binding domain-containing protein [Intestinibacillus massiliensis]|nr:substrate-binding domain-containing protein [Intestinibacillus massiliensis]
MKKRLLAMTLCAFMLGTGLLTGCSGSDDGAAKADGGQPAAPDSGGTAEKLKIGVSLANMSDDFTILLNKGVERAAAEFADEVEFIVLDGKADPTMQLNHIDTYLSQGVDAIVIQPTEADACTSGIELVNGAGIPVVCCNTKTTGGDFVYVGSEDIDAGRMQGEWIAENAPENATYVYAMLVMGQTGQIARREGLLEVLAEKRPDIKCLAEQTSGGMRDQGMKLCEDWLQAYPDFTMYVSQNDSAALGALEVLGTAGKDKLVCGVDGNAEAVQKVANGEMAMTVFQNAEGQAYESCKTALQILKGEFSGDEVIIPFELITKDNAKDYL